MAKAAKDRKERLALSTPAIKKALVAAALKDNKIGVALGVAKPIRARKPASPRSSTSR